MDNGYWRLQSRCDTLAPESFRFEADAGPLLGDAVRPDRLIVQTQYISLDPYLARAMRSWQGEGEGCDRGIVNGRIIAKVIASGCTEFRAGDIIAGVGRWQAEQDVPSNRFRIVPSWMDPPTAILGVLGASGMTAWTGLHLAGAQRGETILVSAATGPVGSVVGQLARARGLRAIGIAGGADKCQHAVGRLGFDACLDHRLSDLGGRLADVAGDGIDIVFENVGSAPLDAALGVVNQHARIMLCGLAAHYNDVDALQLRNFRQLLYRAVTLRGFITAEHPELAPKAARELKEGFLAGRIVHDETVMDGIENAPVAFLEMLRGNGFGKRIIRI